MFKSRVIIAGIFILSIVVLVGSGCSVLQQGSSSSGGGESYFPHAQGNSWRMTSTDGSSQITTVEGTATVGSITVQCFTSLNKMVYSGYTSTYTNESYYRIDSSGVYSHGSPSYPSSIGIPLIQFPLEAGKTWDVAVSGSYSTKATVVSKENVTVPAGTFDCYKINFATTFGTIEAFTSTLWLGNNAGIVKTTVGGSTVESTLAWKNF